MTDLRRGPLAVALSALVAGCSLLAGPAQTPGPTGGATSAAPSGHATPRSTGISTSSAPPSSDASGPTPRPTRKPRPTPTPTPEPTPQPTPMPAIEGLAELLGSDGRFTVLLLGSDARKNLIGERTDTIMIATIDPTTGKVAMVSLPRDTINVPIGPGSEYREKVTGLFSFLHAQTGSRKDAYRRMEKALEYAFGIEIDRYALVGFRGVEHLIDAIGGIDVYLDAPFWDPFMHVTKKGLVLKKGRNHLNGKKALAFARTRHADTDYERSRRQQEMIADTIQKVLTDGLEDLPALVSLAGDQMETDIPLSAAPALYELAQRARLGNFKSVVLGPSTFSTEDPQTYSNILKMDVVRELCRRVFAPVGG